MPRELSEIDRATALGLIDEWKAHAETKDAEATEAYRRLNEMTAARDHCKRQATEAGERWVAEIQGRAALLAEFLVWVDEQEGGPTPQRQEAAEWIAAEFLRTRASGQIHRDTEAK